METTQWVVFTGMLSGAVGLALGYLAAERAVLAHERRGKEQEKELSALRLKLSEIKKILED